MLLGLSLSPALMGFGAVLLSLCQRVPQREKERKRERKRERERGREMAAAILSNAEH